MLILVLMEVYEAIVSRDLILAARSAFRSALERVRASGKVRQSGIFADGRGGFLLLDIDRAEELLELLGAEVLDVCRVTTHPIVPTEALRELFARDSVRQAMPAEV